MLEDDLDELALDNPDTSPESFKHHRLGPSTPNRRHRHRNPGTKGKVGKVRLETKITGTSTPTQRGLPKSPMSSNRYPKRRRVSGREKETTPPPLPSLPSVSQQEEARHRGEDSPDELASNPAPTKPRSRRTNSRPKRGNKDKKKSLPELQKPTVSAPAPEPVPETSTQEASVHEASDDELNATAAEDTPQNEEVEDGPGPPSIKYEENVLNGQGTPIHIPPIKDHQIDDHITASPIEDVPKTDISTVPIVGDTIQDQAQQSPHDAIEDDLPDQSIAQPSIEEPSHLEVPHLRRRSTFKGSFRKLSRTPSPNRYISKSPPPYSRVSTPIATPRELPPAPPQFVPYKEKLVLKGHKRAVAAVKFSPNGRLIASCSADATIRIWEASTGKHLHTLEGHLAGISTIAWMPDSKVIASGSDDKSIRLWYVDTGKMHPRQLTGHSSYVFSLAFSPKGNMLASGSYDEALFLWDVRTQRLMRSHPAHSDPIGGVDFVQDGTLIVSCSSDGLIRVWDTATGQCLRTLVHEDNAGVTNVCFVPNGKYLLAWTLDSSIRLWNYVEGRCMKTYQGHKNEKYSLSGAHGSYTNKEETEKRAFVVSGSEEGNIFTWDINSKEILQTMEGHEGVVLGVDTWEEGELMVSCGMDKTVRIWEKVKEEDEVVDVGADGDDAVAKDLEEGVEDDAHIKSGEAAELTFPADINGEGKITSAEVMQSSEQDPAEDAEEAKDLAMVNGVE